MFLKVDKRLRNDRSKSRFDIIGAFSRRAKKGSARLNFKELTTDYTTDGGAGTETLTAAIPAGAILLGLVGRVTTAITGVTTNFDVGDGTDADLWGNNILLAAGTTFDFSDATADPMGTWSASARDITLTADAGTFTGGVIRITAFYVDTTAPVR